MSLKVISYILLAVLITIVATMLFQLSSKKEKPIHSTAINEDVVQVRSFSVNSDSTELNTSAKGTVFVWGDEGRAKHIQIVASIEVDPKDWGGVSFRIPDKWYISNIISSYPENKTQSKSEDYVSTWTTADTDSKWRTRIEVANELYRPRTGGGTGTIVIDIVHDKDEKHQPETFKIGVTVGSNEKNGVKIIGTDFIEIPISLTDNE